MLEEDFLKAIVKGDSQRVVRLLGQITNTGPLKDGRNALHLAAQYGNSDIVSVLLLSGLYDCNTPDSIGYTAIQIAAADGHLEIVKLLIKHGADVNSADNVHGNSALHEAAWKGFSQTVSELCKAKANLDAKNWGGFTALHLCCQNGHNQSCRELLLAGCDADVQNNYGDTPLHTSARYGHAGVMRILISAQCHVSDQNKNGDTALHIAAAMNRRKLTRILLESKCDKSLVNKQSETAEAIAVRKSLDEILNILKKPPSASKKPKPATNKENVTKKTTKPTIKPSKKPQIATAPVTAKDAATPWSPYGCHYYPDSTDFPEPNLDSLPADPLKKGEQYYLDLAGNIRKGPVGVGYACYCAPFFHELESRIEKKTKKIKKQLHRTEDAINKRLNTLEYCLNGQYKPGSDGVCAQNANLAHASLCQTRSFESALDSTLKEKPIEDDKREGIAYFHNSTDKSTGKISEASSPCCQELSTRRKYLSSGCLDANINLWKNTRIPDADSCESSDEDGEKVDIPCNDSGYSTKMCSNSQGPSPSLSGRLENDGLLSVTPSQEEKHLEEIHSYVTTFQNMTIKQASMV